MTPAIFLLAFVAVFFIAPVRPVVGVYGYVIIYYANPTVRWWGEVLPDIPYGFLIAASTMLGVLLGEGVRNAAEAFLRPIPLLWFALVLLHIVVGFWAILPESHSASINYYATNFIICLAAIAVVDTRNRFRWLLLMFIAGSFYLGYEAFNTGRQDNRLEGIGTADSPDSNDTAALIAAIVPLLGTFALFGRIYIRTAVVLATPFILNALILINSRGAFLGIVVGGVYFLWVLFTSKGVPGQTRRQATVALVLGCGLFLYLADAVFWERMGTILGRSPSQDTAQVYLQESTQSDLETRGGSRMLLWRGGLAAAADNPLGVGTFGFLVLSQNYLPADIVKQTKRGKAVHSTWIQVFVEMGWLGGVIFFTLLFVVWRTLYRAKNAAAARDDHEMAFIAVGLLAGFVTLLTAMSFLDRFRAEIFYWYCAFAVMQVRLLAHARVEPQASTRSIAKTGDAGWSRTPGNPPASGGPPPPRSIYRP